jgi:hypothetical protein
MKFSDLYTDKYGDYDFHGLGPLLKLSFILPFVFFVVKRKIVCTTTMSVLIILFGVACFLNVGKYIDVILSCKKEATFLVVTSHEDLFVGAISIFTGLLCLINI